MSVPGDDSPVDSFHQPLGLEGPERPGQGVQRLASFEGIAHVQGRGRLSLVEDCTAYRHDARNPRAPETPSLSEQDPAVLEILSARGLPINPRSAHRKTAIPVLTTLADTCDSSQASNVAPPDRCVAERLPLPPTWPDVFPCSSAQRGRVSLALLPHLIFRRGPTRGFLGNAGHDPSFKKRAENPPVRRGIGARLLKWMAAESTQGQVHSSSEKALSPGNAPVAAASRHPC